MAPRSRHRRHLLATVVLAMTGSLGMLTGCGGDEAPAATMADVLAEIEGREPTPAEVSRREQVAQVLCRLDERVLREIWDQLDEDQLQFQDFVFARKCGDRNQLYGEATERFRTPDS